MSRILSFQWADMVKKNELLITFNTKGSESRGNFKVNAENRDGY